MKPMGIVLTEHLSHRTHTGPVIVLPQFYSLIHILALQGVGVLGWKSLGLGVNPQTLNHQAIQNP